MKPRDPDILKQTIAFWGKRTGQKISREEARQMVGNVSGFFQVLAEWDRTAKAKEVVDEVEEVVKKAEEM
jgi:hypothetical protein